MAAAAGGSSGSSVAAAAGGSPGAVSSSSSGDGGSGPVVSPFSKASVHRQVGEQHSSSAVPKVRTGWCFCVCVCGGGVLFCCSRG
jgi:hypothetical protein